MVQIKQTKFSMSRMDRDRFCKNKDKVLVPILDSIEISDPQSFRAILMPSLYGIEARLLVKKGVPASNLFAIENNSVERDFNTHDEILNCRLPDRQEMNGMKTTGRPMGIVGALDESWFAFDCRPFNLIYFDLLSQPCFKTHYWGCLRKIIKGGMLLKGGTLMMNFGRSRCRHEVADFNHKLTAEAKRSRGIDSDTENVKVLIEAAAEEWGSSLSQPIESHSYRSGSQTFTTTVAVF